MHRSSIGYQEMKWVQTTGTFPNDLKEIQRIKNFVSCADFNCVTAPKAFSVVQKVHFWSFLRGDGIIPKRIIYLYRFQNSLRDYWGASYYLKVFKITNDTK